MKTVAVLGSTGFVGQHVVRMLDAARYRVVGTSRAQGVDLRDADACNAFFAEVRPDYVVHCAAHVGSVHYVSDHAAEVFSDNVHMALNIYAAVTAHCPQAVVVNPLSNCSYPGAADVQREHEWWNGPVHPSVFSYGNAKKTLYMVAETYAKEHGVRSVNFLVPNTFGPGDSIDPNKTHALNGMIIRMIRAKREGAKQFEIWGTGTPVREWAYVEDVVSLMIRGMESNLDLLSPVNIGQNKGYTIKESAERIREAVGFDGELMFNTSYADGAPVKLLDATRFCELFPNVSFFDHAEGIRRTVAYYSSVLT
jgi:GDP-L-fucose synthase